jgi:hypothetical protein
MNPEEKAREEIDRQLVACGWLVQDHKAMNIMAGSGVAVREFPLKSGFADYLRAASAWLPAISCERRTSWSSDCARKVWKSATRKVWTPPL